MGIGVLKTFGLALFLAGLACLSSVSGQTPKAPAPGSLDWLRGQAEKGNPAAQYILGFNYATGQGVAQDYAEAVRWYRKAADQRMAEAQANLGGMYENGQVVTQDYVEALMWVDLAASRGGGDYQKIYADEREKLAARMPPQPVAEAQRRAREWKPALERNPEAQNRK